MQCHVTMIHKPWGLSQELKNADKDSLLNSIVPWSNLSSVYNSLARSLTNVSFQKVSLFFVFSRRVLEKDHSTGSKICCCIPRYRTPVCVLSVMVKSAAGLKKKSALLSKFALKLAPLS